MKNKAPFIYYFNAKRYVNEKGYFSEAYFHEKASLHSMTKSDFYKEYAWVVLSSGLSEKVVKIVFDKLTLIFNDWKNPVDTFRNKNFVYYQAIVIFNNPQKIKAILEMANYLSRTSYSKIKKSINEHGINFLMSFKFLGPATAYHLAKNLGIDYAKPDRHLIRIADLFGFSCPNEFCESIAQITGEKKSVIDIILWRYATLNRNYLKEVAYG